MPNEKTIIDSELAIIKEAGRGEDVRAAIISAIKKIYNTREYPPTTKKFTHNTNPEGETGGPWNKVIVQVNDSPSLEINDMSQHPITQNGYYNIQTLKDMGYIESPTCDGIDGFNVAVNQVPGNFGVINITENGVYDPLLDGYDGYSKVYVNVLGGARKDYYTVKFYDGKTLLAAVSVAYGQNATYPENKGLPNSGGTFTGWNPNPVSVSRDMNCYAVYAGQGATGAGALVETISDTWQTICTKVKAGNRPYEVGSTKLLRLKGYGGAEYILNMMLIGYNLDITQNGKYANSTWLNINKNGVFFNSQATNHIFGPGISVLEGRLSVIATTLGNTLWWGNSLTRALFNRDPSGIIYSSNPGGDDLSYYKAMLAQGLTLPDTINDAAGFDLFSAMESVKKYSNWNVLTPIAGTQQYNQYKLVDQPTVDKIWLPNYKEMLVPYAPGASETFSNAKGQAGLSYGNPGIFSTTDYNLYHGEQYARNWTSRDVNPNLTASGVTKLDYISHVLYNTTTAFVANANGGNTLPIGFCI